MRSFSFHSTDLRKEQAGTALNQTLIVLGSLLRDAGEHYPSVIRVVLVALHGVSLPGPGLSVSKDR
jgi:hypothetical protein